MEFTIPTTKPEMYTTLMRIFHYYRIRYDDYEEAITQPIVVSPIVYTQKTENQMRQIATALLAGEHSREVYKAKAEISDSLYKIAAEKVALTSKGETLIAKAEESFDEAIKKVGYVSERTGTENTDFYAKKVLDLETEKAKKIAEINASISSEMGSLTAKETALTEKLSEIDDDFAAIHAEDIAAKVIELQNEESELMRSVLKYNNTINEKSAKYLNAVAETKAKLRIEYMKIRQVSFGKDDLVEMGYYRDAISCVTGYYDTLSASDAYNDIKNEANLIPYLEDYYETIIYLYKTRVSS